MDAAQLKEEYMRLLLSVNNDPEKQRRLNDCVQLYTLLEEIENRRRQEIETANLVHLKAHYIGLWTHATDDSQKERLFYYVDLYTLLVEIDADRERARRSAERRGC